MVIRLASSNKVRLRGGLVALADGVSSGGGQQTGGGSTGGSTGGGSTGGTAGTGVTVNDVASNLLVYQRVGTSKTITVSGTYTGAPSSIQACVVDASTGVPAMDWVTIATNPAGGNFSGQLAVPQGGWYKLQVRDGVDNTLVATGGNKFGVGMIIAMIGQSNMANMPGTPYKYPLGDAKAVEYVNGAIRRVGNVNDQYQPNTLFGAYGSYTTVGSNGDGHVYFANLMSEGLGIPVCILNAAIGGTSITSWQSNGTSWTNGGGTSNKRFKELMQDLGSDFEMAIWYQGEQDAAAMSAATWSAYLANVQANCKALNGRNDSTFKFGVVSLGFGSYNGSVEGDFGKMRVAQIAYATSTPGAFLVSCNYDAKSATGDVHLDGISFSRKGPIYAKNALFALGIGTSGAGPRITGAVRSGLNIDVTVAHSGGTGLTDGAGGTGGAITTMRVYDGGVQATIASTTILNSTTIRLTLAAAPAGAVTLDNAIMNCPSGANASTYTPATTVYDNASVYNGTVGCPLQPKAAFAVA